MKKQVTLSDIKGAASYLAKILGVKFDAPYSESGPNDIHLEEYLGKYRLMTQNGSNKLTLLLTKRELLEWIWAYREGLEHGIALQTSRQMAIKCMEKFNNPGGQQ